MFVETEKMELLPIRKTQRVLVRVPLSVSGKMNDEIALKKKASPFPSSSCGLLQLRNWLAKSTPPPIPAKSATGVLRCHTR